MNPVGLLVVHGIGHQRPGALAQQLATTLADPPAQTAALAPTGDVVDQTMPVWLTTVGGRSVHLCEAQWADLSDPDNPPELRLTPRILAEYVDTVATAVRSSGLGSRFRWRRRAMPAVRELVLWAVVGILMAVAGWAANRAAPVTLDSTEPPIPLVSLLLGGPFVACCGYATWRRLRRKGLSLRHAHRVRRLVTLVACLPVAGALTVFGLARLLVVTEVLFAFALFVVVASIADYVMWLPTALLRWLGGLLQIVKPVGRWVYRLGWVLLVLPTQALAQSIRATGILVSVFFTERGARIRAAALAGMAGVYLAFIPLALISELLLLPVLSPLLKANVPPYSLLEYLLFAALYLGFVKLLLPTLDLILDVSNYHLASGTERARYHRRLTTAIDRLRASGCGEIHVLAHSLGSVMVYDWLHSLPAGSNSVAVLHTIGSPLDLFWYVDHDRSTRLADRDGLAGCVSRAWINHYAYSDPVCLGSALRRYDGPGLRVENTRIPWLGPFLVSHARYWKNRAVISRLHAELSRGYA